MPLTQGEVPQSGGEGKDKNPSQSFRGEPLSANLRLSALPKGEPRSGSRENAVILDC